MNRQPKKYAGNVRIIGSDGAFAGEMGMLRFDARNVRLRKVDTAERACGLVAQFLGRSQRERELMAAFLVFMCATHNRTRTSEEIGRFRRSQSIPKSSFFVLLSQLEKLELLRKIPWAGHEGGYLYYLHEDFGRALYRVLRAYRRYMLPERKRANRMHAPFLK